MVRTTLLATAAAMAAVWVLAPAPALAETFRVPDQFGEIQDALDVAGPCDVVEVDDGDYLGSVAVGIGVTLRAVGDDVVIDGGGFDENGGQIDFVVSLTNGSRVEGFELHNARNGVSVVGNWSVASGNTIRDVDVGISLEGSVGYAVGNTIGDGVDKGVGANGAIVWLDANVIDGAETGVDLFQTEFRLLGNTVTGSGRGYSLTESWGEVTSCILTGNDIGFVVEAGSVVVQDCAVDGNLVGGQVLEGDPLLLDNDFAGNQFGITTLLSSPSIVGNRVTDSVYAGIAADLGSEPRVANNLLVDNTDGLSAVLSSPVFVNNTVVGGERGVVVRSSDASVINHVLTGASVVAIDASDGPALEAGFNLFWENADDLLGYVSDGTDVFGEDPLLDGDWLASSDSSPVVDGGNTNVAYEDPDGTIADIGHGGGPEADDAYVELPGGPPVSGEQSPYEFQEGEQGVVFVQNIVDERNDPLEFRWDIDPDDGLTYCDGYANAVDFQPPDEGTYSVWVRAEDSEGFEVEAEIVITAHNHEPEVTLDLFEGFAEGTESQMHVDVFDWGLVDELLVDIDTDDDGQYERQGLEPGFISWTPPQSGQVTIRVRGYDDDGGEDVVEQPTFVENLPPFLAESPPDEIFVGQAWSYTLQVDDPSDLDTVTVTLDDGPEGMELDGDRLSWEPRAADVGINPYDLTLTDSDGDAVQYFLRIGVFTESDGCGCDLGSWGGSAGAGWVLAGVVILGRRRRCSTRRHTEGHGDQHGG